MKKSVFSKRLIIGYIVICFIIITAYNLLLIKKPESKKIDISHTSIYGEYLAANYAFRNLEFKEAARIFREFFSKSNNQNELDFASTTYLANIVAGDFDYALSIAKSYKNINYISSHYLEVIICLQQQKFKEAIRILNSLDAINYFDSFIREMLIIWASFDNNEVKKAMNAFDTLEVPGNLYNVAKLQQALLYDLANDQKQAMEAYTELENDLSDFYYSNLIGNFYERTGDLIRAKLLYEKSISLNSEISLSHNFIGGDRPIKSSTQAMAQFFTDIAKNLMPTNTIHILEYLQLALYIDPSYEQAKLMIANFYFLNKKYEYAIDILTQIDATSDYYEMAQIELANILIQQNKKLEARNLLKNILVKSPNIMGLSLFSLIVNEENNEKELIDILNLHINKITELEKSHWILFYLRASEYHLLHELELSEQDYLQSFALAPDNCTVANDLSYNWLLQQKNYDQAFDLIIKAMKKCPASPALIDSMGWAYYIKNDYINAKKYIEEALKLDPDNVEILEHLGDVYGKLMLKTQSKFHYEHALNVCTNPKIINRLKAKLNEK